MKNRTRICLNKKEGFSLIELIIVISIMAILIGVIILAVIPNIQRSRESKDLTKLDNIMSAANIAVANSRMKNGETASVSYASSTGTMSFGSGTPEAFKKAYRDSIGESPQMFESSVASSSGILCSVSIGTDDVASIVVKANPAVTLTYTTDDKGNEKTLKVENTVASS